MNPDLATREVLWNIDQQWLIYALLVPTMAIAVYGVIRRARKWFRGQPAVAFDQPLLRLRRLFRLAVVQSPLWRTPAVAVMHGLLFWAFIVLTVATTVVMVHHDFGVPIMQGAFYLWFQSLFVDAMGLLATVAVAMAMFRRWLVRPPKLVQTRESDGLLVLILTILVSGFLLEGWRIAVTHDPWAAWSPVGNLIGRASLAVADPAWLQRSHFVVWWGHLLLVFGFIAWAPYTKMLHVLTTPLNIYTASLALPATVLKSIDFETAENLGVNRLEHFSWKDLLDLDACTECGRCTSVCPAHQVGKSLSPRDVILDLRKLLHAPSTPTATVTPTSGSVARPVDSDSPSRASGLSDMPIISSAAGLEPESLWQCTTCAACVEICPVAIEQFPKIIDMRRHLVMEEAELPDSMQAAMTSLEQRGHPFRGTQASRTDWADGLDIPHFREVEDPEVLLWVGCGGALVERNQSSTRALAQLLQKAGIRFGILGRDEACTGDPARRMGNEFLFDTLVRKNMDTFDAHHVTHVVTSCPHCFNTFRNEYPQFGAKFEVFHHTTYLAKLIGSGLIKVDAPTIDKITLHDPCYLGRHNNVTQAPREILQTVAGTAPVEMEQHGKQSFCCGGGGGMSFVDEPAGQRVNRERARQAVASGADTVAVACPFCTTMLEDGLGGVDKERPVRVKDVAELLWEAVANET